MKGTPESTKASVRSYYAGSTELYLANWAGQARAFHLGLDDGTCATRDDALIASNEYLADRARVGRGTKVLDAGCGVGGSALWLAEKRGATVVGITLAPAQVVIAEKWAEEASMTGQVTFLEMDFAATSFESGRFDVVWNLESMCHAFDKAAYLRHVFDLLAPGGRFVCLDMFGTGKGDPADVQAMCTRWSLPSLPPVNTLCDWLSDAGFHDVETEDLTARVERPLQALEAMALNADQLLRIERKVHGSCPPGHEAHVGHVQGALACARGARAGSLVYAYLGAIR